jgi:hypothetical protein
MAETSITKQLPAALDMPEIRPWREMTVLGLMAMSLSWGIPWFRSLTYSTYILPSEYLFSVFGGIMLAAYIAMRLIGHWRLKIELRRTILASLFAACIVIGLRVLLYREETLGLRDLLARPLKSFSDIANLVPDEFIIMLAVILVMRKGLQLATDSVGPRMVMGAFRTGLVFFVFFVFINTFVTGEGYGNFAHLFIFAGLLAMGAARVDTLRTLRGGRKNPFDGRWLSNLLLAVFVVIGMASWAGAALSGEDGFFATLPRLIIGGALGIGFLAATPLFLVFTWLLYSIVGIIEPDSPLAETLRTTVSNVQTFLDRLQAFLVEHFGFMLPVLRAFERLAPAIKALVLFGALMILIGLILLSIHVRRLRTRRQLDEENQDLSARDALKAFNRKLKERMDAAAKRLGDLADMRRRQRLLAAFKIRRTYARMLDLSQRLGRPRPSAHTPQEFLPAAISVFDGQDRALGIITDAYERVRYGEFPEDPKEVEIIERAWHEVQQVGLEKLKSRRDRS